MNTKTKLKLALGGSLHEYEPMHMCPKCNAYSDKEVPNKGILNRYFFWLPIYTYQCESCAKDFTVIKRGN